MRLDGKIQIRIEVEFTVLFNHFQSILKTL
jgi:hypothetical protein